MNTKLTPYQYAALHNPYPHFAFYGGIATGKTFTGAHFAIKMMNDHPEASGFIGANSYDQLSQATLKEFFYWLDYYGYEWVSDCRPPLSWGQKREFKKYSNIISVRVKGKVVTIFTRVLSDPNALRGLEFTWYWLDELRDTEKEAHDIVLSRLRETEVIKGLCTTTTNGEEWDYDRFVKSPQDGIYGCMHVETYESVKQGIISEDFYQQLAKSYPKNLADQELRAMHVVVTGQPAYMPFTKALHVTDHCPFTKDGSISRYLPIIVAMDFNLNPMSWHLGQRKGEDWYWHDKVHLENSHTPEAAKELVEKVKGWGPGIILCGDATSKAGQRAAAGQSDYDIICSTLDAAGVRYTNETPDSNPTIRDRVNNVNARLLDGQNQTHMWIHSRCKELIEDFEKVQWKKNAVATLDPGTKGMLTHPSDGIGYAISAMTPIPSRHQVGNMVVIRR